MCGRFTLTASGQQLMELFGWDALPEDYRPRFNIAPGQPILAVRGVAAQGPGSDDRPSKSQLERLPNETHHPQDSAENPGDRSKQHSFQRPLRRVPGYLHWGLVPYWAKDPKIGYRMINARSESVSEKPSFKRAFERRRCLIPADGFYEWRQEGKKKQPFYFQLSTGGLFALAGLWESWRPRNSVGSGGSIGPGASRDPGDFQGQPNVDALFSCTILTTDANELVSKVHHRMPVILKEEDFDLWLDPDVPGEGVRHLLRPYDAAEMSAYPVSTFVNAARNEGEECVRPIGTMDDSAVGADSL